MLLRGNVIFFFCSELLLFSVLSSRFLDSVVFALSFNFKMPKRKRKRGNLSKYSQKCKKQKKARKCARKVINDGSVGDLTRMVLSCLLGKLEIFAVIMVNLNSNGIQFLPRCCSIFWKIKVNILPRAPFFQQHT